MDFILSKALMNLTLGFLALVKELRGGSLSMQGQRQLQLMGSQTTGGEQRPAQE